MKERLDPKDAAMLFINTYFPSCNGALLSGSTVRGEATNTSDLDIVIFDSDVPTSYRESLLKFGWPIEVFVHNLCSYYDFFKSDCQRARPALPKMVDEGIVLRDDGVITKVKKEAKLLLDKGPEAWSEETIDLKRYFITDVLEDFIGSNNRAEDIMIVHTLSELVSEFVLRTNGQWLGSSKWTMRALIQFDNKFAATYIETLELFYKTGEKRKLIKLVENVLEPHGGRLFAGFSLGKNKL